MSGKKAKQVYGIRNHSQKLNPVKEVIANYQEIHEEIMKLAHLEETALLRSMGVADEVESETETSEDESDIESVSESSFDNQQCSRKGEVKITLREESIQTKKPLKSKIVLQTCCCKYSTV